MRLVLRWAVVTQSGKNLRVYGENKLHVFKVLKSVGERWAHIEPAGCFHEHVGLDRPEWDGTSSQGYPGGPSGRPPQKATKAKPVVVSPLVSPQGAPQASPAATPTTHTINPRLPLWRVVEKKQKSHRSRTGIISGVLVLVCERQGQKREAVVPGSVFDVVRVGDEVGLREDPNPPRSET